QFRRAVLLRDAILPRAEQMVAISESSYVAGRSDFLDWIDNWRQYLELTLEYHRALASLEQELAGLEELAGGGLARSSTDTKSGEALESPGRDDETHDSAEPERDAGPSRDEEHRHGDHGGA